MCENNMKNMHTDVRINDYFSSENIAFTLSIIQEPMCFIFTSVIQSSTWKSIRLRLQEDWFYLNATDFEEILG